MIINITAVNLEDVDSHTNNNYSISWDCVVIINITAVNLEDVDSYTNENYSISWDCSLYQSWRYVYWSKNVDRRQWSIIWCNRIAVDFACIMETLKVLQAWSGWIFLFLEEMDVFTSRSWTYNSKQTKKVPNASIFTLQIQLQVKNKDRNQSMYIKRVCCSHYSITLRFLFIIVWLTLTLFTFMINSNIDVLFRDHCLSSQLDSYLVFLAQSTTINYISNAIFTVNHVSSSSFVVRPSHMMSTADFSLC